MNIDITNAINPLYKWVYNVNAPIPQFRVWTIESQKLFNKKWTEYLNSLGLETAYTSIVFYRPPGGTDQMAHIDLDSNSTQDNIIPATFAINWIVGGKDSKMIWYDLPQGHMTVTQNAPMVYDVKWPIDQLTEIDSKALQLEPTLVRVDVPHAVQAGDQCRWCISLRIYLDNMSWEEGVAYFKQKGLIS